MMATNITQKGQVTIPSSVRREMGLKSGEKVLFEKKGEDFVVKKLPNFLDLMGSIKTKKKYSEKAINKAIGEMFAEKQRRINEQANRR